MLQLPFPNYTWEKHTLRLVENLLFATVSVSTEKDKDMSATRFGGRCMYRKQEEGELVMPKSPPTWSECQRLMPS